MSDGEFDDVVNGVTQGTGASPVSGLGNEQIAEGSASQTIPAIEGDDVQMIVTSPVLKVLMESAVAAALSNLHLRTQPQQPVQVSTVHERYPLSEVANQIPHFEGTRTDELLVEHWIERVRAVRSRFRLDESTIALLATNRLRGRARTWFLSDPSLAEATWPTIERKMKIYFGLEIDRITLYEEMRKRQWDASEPIEEYYQAKLLMLQRLDMKPDEQVSYLIRGINEDVLRVQLRALNPTSVEDLLLKMKALADELRAPRVEAPERTVARPVATAVAEPRAVQTSIRCYNCSQRGHHSRDCPERGQPARCFVCRLPGHKMTNCPTRRATTDETKKESVNLIEVKTKYHKTIETDGNTMVKEQEREFLKKTIAQLNEALNKLQTELLNVRQENATRLGMLDAKVTKRSEEVRILSEANEELKKSNEAMMERYSDLVEKMKIQQKTEQKMNEAFEAEVQSQTRVAELCKDALKEHKRDYKELKRSVCELQTMMRQTLLKPKEYDFEKKHRPGERMRHVDCQNRGPVDINVVDDDCENKRADRVALAQEKLLEKVVDALDHHRTQKSYRGILPPERMKRWPGNERSPDDDSDGDESESDQEDDTADEIETSGDEATTTPAEERPEDTAETSQLEDAAKADEPGDEGHRLRPRRKSVPVWEALKPRRYRKRQRDMDEFDPEQSRDEEAEKASRARPRSGEAESVSGKRR